MTRTYGTTASEAQIVRDRTEGMMKIIATQLDSHPQIIGMAMVSIIADWYGQEGLDDLIEMARHHRQILMREQKADVGRGRKKSDRRP